MAAVWCLVVVGSFDCCIADDDVAVAGTAAIAGQRRALALKLMKLMRQH